jgi:hypothetical protein
MLPEIVRAAAEPLSNIDTLTVLSNEGASDLVKTVTQTVTEANTTVKGLTGIDIPALISSAIGGSEPPSSAAARPPRRGTGGGGGSGGTGGTGAGGAGGAGGTGGTGRGSGAASASAQAEVPTASPSIGQAWGARPSTATAETTGTAGATAPAVSTAPRIETPAAADAAMAAADKAIRSAEAGASKPGQMTDTAAGPARPARGTRPASADITTATTVDEAAVKLASDLRAVPGIERFATVRLADLESGGPRPLRTMWRISRDQLDQNFGQLTIGELLDRYGGGQQPSV